MDNYIKGLKLCIADIYYDVAADKMDVIAAHVGTLTDENKKTI